MDLINKLKNIVRSQPPVWSGDYSSWEEASAKCANYSDRSILEKVRKALIEVKEGRAAFERDSVLFYEPDYNWPMLSALLYAFANENGRLNVIDFGGSLGSTYFQHRAWFKPFQYTWNVVEQEHFVEAGRVDFQSDQLKFHNQIEEAASSQATFLLLSSVLAYLPDPYDWMNKLLSQNYKYVFIDRTPLISGKDRLTIQQVPKEIYEASYPSWFFNEQKFMTAITKKYKLFASVDCVETADFPSNFKGHFLTLA
ncbi:MAG TPA: methyltransferase, TIGR04325 family [Cyclobacteriaceae bacterium]|nr:methyltransferase, TIGR04325 family [Cyclobacteriaceae bacterium]